MSFSASSQGDRVERLQRGGCAERDRPGPGVRLSPSDDRARDTHPLPATRRRPIWWDKAGGNRSGLGASGGANLIPDGAGSRCWRYGVTCPRRLPLHPSVPSPNRFDLSGSREARVTTRSPRYIGCPAFEQPRCATKAPAAPEGALSVTEHKPRLAAVGEAAAAHTQLEAALFEIKRVIVGQEGTLERVLVALLSNGHLLLEGVPGLAKTLTISTVARVLGGTFHRVQFTPDLVPSDLVGTRIYRPDSGNFDT